MLKKYLVNLLLVCWLLVMLIDAAPLANNFWMCDGIEIDPQSFSKIPEDWKDDPNFINGILTTEVYFPSNNWHGYLKEELDPYLDATGLWQGGWQLFAPEPDKINASISADLAFADGTKLVLESPKWRELSAWERLLRFREAEFIDSVRSDGNSCLWPGYAKYLRETVRHPSNPNLKATEVLLTRHWIDIAPPNSFNVTQFPEPPEQTNHFIIFAEMYDEEKPKKTEASNVIDGEDQR